MKLKFDADAMPRQIEEGTLIMAVQAGGWLLTPSWTAWTTNAMDCGSEIKCSISIVLGSGSKVVVFISLFIAAPNFTVA